MILFDCAYQSSFIVSCMIECDYFTRAAITIQRGWRDYKGIPDPAEAETDLDRILSPLTYGAVATSLPQSSAGAKNSSQQLTKDSQSTTRSRGSNRVSLQSSELENWYSSL